jgi:hypothetical protein
MTGNLTANPGTVTTSTVSAGAAGAGTKAAALLPVTYLEEERFGAVDSRASDHNLPLAIDIRGPLDRELLLESLRALTQRHETLRMAFQPSMEGQPGGEGLRRAVWPGIEPRIATVDLSNGCTGSNGAGDSGAGDAGRDRELDGLILDAARNPIDLTRPPLWRATLVRLSPDHHVLVTTWHHVIFDGWSSRVVFRDLARCYEGALRGARSPLPEPEIQLADYAGWERDITVPSDAAAYWRRVLPGEAATLPLESATAHGPQVLAGRPYPAIPAGQVGRLEEIARTSGVSLTSVLRAVVLTALRPYLPDQPVIGFVYANRERPELQPVIGLLSDHLPVRVDLTGGPSFRDLSVRVHEAVRTARRHQLPTGVIAGAVAPPPNGGQLFDISVNNMRQAAPLVEKVTGPGGAVLTFRVREVPSTELWPRITRPFSGGARLGYQLRRTLGGELTGEIWGHVPAFRITTIDALGAALARTAAMVASDEERD